jgi:ABC-type amino acid transport substrate-binding protein
VLPSVSPAPLYPPRRARGGTLYAPALAAPAGRKNGSFLPHTARSGGRRWVGTEQARSFKIDGNRLQVLTHWRVMPNWADKGMTRSVVTFERANAEQTADPRVADLVRAGKVRFGTFPPQYTKDATTGELRGPWVEVMRALAAHMGLPAVLIELPTPNKLVECLDIGPCDVGSLGFDPARADQVGGFTPPFMQVEYTYLVPSGSALHSVADADRPGVRVAVVRNHASTLALNRIAKHAFAPTR